MKNILQNCLVLLLFTLTALPTRAEDSQEEFRTRSGLVALYDFQSTDGNIVHDRSGVGQPVNLEIKDAGQVQRIKGLLEVRGNTLIQSVNQPRKIIEFVRRTNEITVEAWIRPAFVNQDGPARIVTLSNGSSNRNITLGQDNNQYDIRTRTTNTSSNGLPSVNTSNHPFSTELTHFVFTRDRSGRARVYINGKKVKEQEVKGDTFNWGSNYHLALANETDSTRAWLGTYYLVALYSRDLLPQEIEQHFKAGPNAKTEPSPLAQHSSSSQANFFQAKVAPLFANHCLECHDSSTNKGELDLSKKEKTFAGGKSGEAITPGKADESLLYTIVESNVMPLNRNPLSDEEKKILKQWIVDGAEWNSGEIDPAVLTQGETAHENFLRRLTVDEYIETVRSITGVDIAKEARDLLPADLRADGFSNTAYNLNVDLKHIETYAKLAEIITRKMDVVAYAKQYTNSERLIDDNMRPFIAKMGKRILRGPLREYEVALYRGISTTVTGAGGDFKEAVTLILEAMLQSPRFLYRIENQMGDGTLWPVGDYELASRLSYILWGAPPDEELIRAADAGELYDRTGVEAQIRRMLYDSRTIKRSAEFVSEWLDLDRLENLRPNQEHFPKWDKKLADDMREETLAFFEDVIWKQNRPLADLFNAQFTYVTERLAKHYGLEPKLEGLSRYDVSDVPERGGLITQGSILTVGGDEASMVTRGLFVLHDVLRGKVSDPPPCVDTTPVATQPGVTNRIVAERRLADSSCGGCHAKFEPLAFGLEKFDGLGSYQEKDQHGNQLREDGEILFPGESEPIAYQTSKELMNILADSERASETITWKLTQFAMGRPLGQRDAPIIKSIHQSAQEHGGTYISLISAIMLSDLVQKTPTENIP